MRADATFKKPQNKTKQQKKKSSFQLDISYMKTLCLKMTKKKRTNTSTVCGKSNGLVWTTKLVVCNTVIAEIAMNSYVYNAVQMDGTIAIFMK